jgi:glucose-1-phosphate thymidylyltransferase
MPEIVGLLPAAGMGSRLGAIPCSKEIMPLGFQEQPTAGGMRQRPITTIETHLRALQLAGVARAVIAIGESKHDIVRYLGNGERYSLSIAYVYQQLLRGMPFALDLAAPWIGDATTLFAMPDTLITPVETAARLVQHHHYYSADLTLGLFPTNTPHKFGMVELDSDRHVVNLIDKPAQTDLLFMWGLAVWEPRFTRFMSSFLAQSQPHNSELVLNTVFLSAMHSGLSIQAHILDGSHYADIGTPEDFQAVVSGLALRQADLFGISS